MTSVLCKLLSLRVARRMARKLPLLDLTSNIKGSNCGAAYL